VSLFTFCQWIETTSLSTAIQKELCTIDSRAFHMVGSDVRGMVLMGDLSVLRIGLHVPAADLLSQFRALDSGWDLQ